MKVEVGDKFSCCVFLRQRLQEVQRQSHQSHPNLQLQLEVTGGGREI